MDMKLPTLMEKCKGAILGSAIGDALGWPNERNSKKRIKKGEIEGSFIEWTRTCRKPFFHTETIFHGEYSDDTQMMLSVARSIIFGDWEYFFMEKELPFWLQYERGGGRALLRAARFIRDKGMPLWKSGRTREYFLAGGNGAAMRILPHVIAHAGRSDITSLMVDVIKNTLITHGHPRAFMGATCYAFALMYLLRKDTFLEYGELVSAVMEGSRYWSELPSTRFFEEWLGKANLCAGFNYMEEWEKTRDRMLRQFAFIQKSLKNGLMDNETNVLYELGCLDKVKGAGDVTALAAVYLASKYAADPILGIKTPAFLTRADTDTLASITGGLLGMLSGVSWIPVEWSIVQDYECLSQIAEILLSENKDTATRTRLMNTKELNYDWVSSPIGRMRLVDSLISDNERYGEVTIEKWKTMLGQTIYVKKIEEQDRERRLEKNKEKEKKKIDIQPSISSDEKLQSTTYHQVEFKRESLKKRELPKKRRQLILSDLIIQRLLESSRFNKAVSVGKFLKVVQALTINDEPESVISKKFTIDVEMVELIKKEFE